MIQNYIPKAIQPPKSDGYLELDKSSISSFIGASEDVTVSFKLSSGAVSAVSSDTDVCTVSVNEDIVTVTGVDEGEASVTITVAGDNIYKDASIVAFVEISDLQLPALNLCTPAQIQVAAQAGIGQLFWNIGDCTAEITFGYGTIDSFYTNAVTARAYIIGFDHNSSIEGTGIHFLFGKNINGIEIAFLGAKMNATDTNTGGWENSLMRTTYLPIFFNALPNEWQNVISYCDKYTNNTGYSSAESAVTKTSDKIWLLGAFEVYETDPYGYVNSYEASKQEQYAYYVNGNSTIKYAHSYLTDTISWWLRSPCTISSEHFMRAGSGNNYAGFSIASGAGGLAPAFKIGGE